MLPELQHKISTAHPEKEYEGREPHAERALNASITDKLNPAV